MRKLVLLFCVLFVMLSSVVSAQQSREVVNGASCNIDKGDEVFIKIPRNEIYWNLRYVDEVDLYCTDSNLQYYYGNLRDFGDSNYHITDSYYVNNCVMFKIKVKTNARLSQIYVSVRVHFGYYSRDVYFYINITEPILSPEIKRIEQLPYSCGARVNVLMEEKKVGSGLKNLRYKTDKDNHRNWKKSSSFIFDEPDGVEYITFYVEDVTTGKVVSKKQRIRYEKATIKINSSITSSNCGDTKGEINASIEGGWRYLNFNSQYSYIDIPERSILGKGAFTMEGDIRMDAGTLQSYKTIGLFGINNVVEFGFQGKSISGWMNTNQGSLPLNYNTDKIFPDDGGWHNVVLRYDGTTMEILVDGNVFASIEKRGVYLQDQNGDRKKYNFRVGFQVWNEIDVGFKGSVSRISFWEKALTNDELHDLRVNPPDGSETGLLAAYTMHERDENILRGVKGPNGTMSQVSWSDKTIYKWSKKENGVFKRLSNTTNKLIDSKAGEYKINVIYETGDCGNIYKEKTVTLTNKKYLKVDIISSLQTNYCAGSVINLDSKIDGGAVGAFPIYSWECSNGTSYFHPIGRNNKMLNHTPAVGENKYRLVVRSGNCEVVTDPVSTEIKPLIKTGRIVRVR